MDLYPHLKDIAVSGAKYDDIVRAEEANNLKSSEQTFSPDDGLNARLVRHRERHSMFERQICDGRWVLVNENRTSDDGTVVLYTDITELKRRECEI